VSILVEVCSSGESVDGQRENVGPDREGLATI
jgi:hypothetical protein